MGGQFQFPTRYEEACKIDIAESFSEIFYASEWKCIENPKSQRQIFQWKNVSFAMQGLSQRNLMAPSRMFVLQIRKWMQIWRKVLQVDEQPSKRSEKNGVKSAVAVLKLGDWYGSLVINQGQGRPGQPGKKRGNKLERGPSKHRSSSARQLGCVFQDVKPPKSVLREEHGTCRVQSNVWNSRRLLHVTLKFETKILRSDSFAQVNLISAASTFWNLRIGFQKRRTKLAKNLFSSKGET